MSVKRPSAAHQQARVLRGRAIYAAVPRPGDRQTELATALGGRYGLRAADAAHLATAINVGADRFITSNRRDFPHTISEVQVTCPADLPDSEAAPADN